MDYVVVAVLATLCAAMQCIVVRAPSMTWQRIWSPELGWASSRLEWFRILIQFAFSSSSPSYSSFASKNCPCDHYLRCSGDAPGSRCHLPTGSSLLAPRSGEGEERHWGRSCWRLLHCPLLPRLCASPTIQGGEPTEKSCLWGINRGVKGKENKKKISLRAIQIINFNDLRKTKNNLDNLFSTQTSSCESLMVEIDKNFVWQINVGH